MKINYKPNFITQNIDLKKLRPGNSYGNLQKNRNSYLINNKKSSSYLVKRNCPSCNKVKSNLLLKKDGFSIVKCKYCDLIYVNPILDSEKYLNTYKSKTYQNIMKSLGEKSHKYRLERFGKERTSYLKKYLGNKKKINLLDIGCSTGFFIEAAKKEGWRCEGLELNPSAARFGIKRGLKIYQTNLENFKTNIKYDIITLFDVLEHLSNPKQIIKYAKKILKKNGLLYVYVPNWDSASRILMKEKNCHFIWPTHHLTYFTPKTLLSFFNKLKFKLVDWETQGLDLFDYAWFLKNKKKNFFLNEEQIDILQGYINSSGNGKNLRMLVKKN